MTAIVAPVRRRRIALLPYLLSLPALHAQSSLPPEAVPLDSAAAFRPLSANWKLAGDVTGVRGRLVIAGFHQDGPRTVDLQLWNWRGIDVVNAHERAPAVALDGIRQAAARLGRTAA